MATQINKDAQEAGGWLLIVAQFPTDDPSIRMRVLRTLESLGAASLRDGVFVLPVSSINRQALDRLSEYIVKNVGSSLVFHATTGSAGQERAIQFLFDRSYRYAELVKTVESLKLGFGVSDPGALSRVLHKQRREFDAISALDFFPSEARLKAQMALQEAARTVQKLVFPTRTQSSPAAGERLHGRTWATRKPLWADRLACAWLIRRFIDPAATLHWLEHNQACPADALGFAFEGAHFVNSENRVTFEDLLLQVELTKDPALGRIGSIVHFLEVGGTAVPEAAGVETLLQGAVRRSANDNVLLVEAEKTFDLLYEAY